METIVSVNPIYTIGVDDRGNLIQLMDNRDGTWIDLYNERVLDDDLVQRYFASQLRNPGGYPANT